MFKPKCAKKDYTKENLPHNRKEVFFDVLKLHGADLLKQGFVLLLFSLPFCAISAFKFLITAIYQSELIGISDMELLNEIKNLVAFDNLWTLIEIPMIMLIFLGLAGVARVIRQYAWEENVSLLFDFKTGVKQNYKQYLSIAFAFALFRFIYTVIQNQIMLSLNGLDLFVIIASSVLLSLFFFPVLIYTLVSASIYNNSFITNLRIAFALYGSNVLKTIFIFIPSVLIVLIQFISNIYCKSIVMILFILLIPTLMLGWWLYSYDLLDSKINIINHRELIGKGTYPDSK